MSCSKCHKSPCSCGCSQTTPCSGTCHGNTTDFACVEYTGNNLTCTGISKYDNLVEATGKIEDAICTLNASSGKVMVAPDTPCAKTLTELIVPGANIGLTLIGSGCNRQLRIDSVTGGTVQDIYARVSSADTTADYLNSKILTGAYLNKVLSAPGDQKMTLDVVPSALLSVDPANQISLGFDGGFFYNGVQRARPCFNDTWTSLTIFPSGLPVGVTHTSGTIQYKIGYDGTVHFRGYVELLANFTSYKSSNTTWQYSIPFATVFPQMSCFTSGEIGVPVGQNRQITTSYRIDVPASTTPAIVQSYGYSIERVTTSLQLQIFGAYEANTTRPVRVSLEGVTIQPNI